HSPDAAVRQGGGEMAAVAPDRPHLGAHQQLDPGLAHRLGEMLAHVLVEAAQDLFAAIDDRHLHPEALQQAGELERDEAAALDQHLVGKCLEVEDLVAGDRELRPFDRRPVRDAAGGHEDVPRLDALAGGEQPDPVGALDDRARIERLDARRDEVAAIDLLEPGDLAILRLAQPVPVEGGRADVPAESARVLEEIGEPAREHQQLLGHAAADHAGTAVAELLGHDHPGAVARRDPGRAHAARAAADHEEIHLPVHCAFLPAAGPEAGARPSANSSSIQSDTRTPAAGPRKAAPIRPIDTLETVTGRLASAPRPKRRPKGVTNATCSTRRSRALAAIGSGPSTKSG